MPGSGLNSALHLRCQLLKRQGQRYGFNGMEGEVNPTAVSGAAPDTGNLVFMPPDNLMTAPVDIGDE